MNDKLFLLTANDNNTCGWCLGGIFDDNKDSWKTINEIVRFGIKHKVIKGQLVKEFFGEDF